jgi:hypothetical protein
MSRISRLTLGIALTMLAASNAHGQWNVARFGTERHRVYTTFGLDPAFVTSVGYARTFPVMAHEFQMTGEVGMASHRADTHDFRSRVGLQTSLVRWKAVNLSGSATFVSRGTDNAIYRGFNFGADLAGAVGVYRPRWFVAGEMGLDKAVITHVTHSAYYRDTFYPDEKDGWYLDAGGTIHHGLSAGLTLGKAELVTRAGWLRTERYNSLMPPFYGTVGLGVGF